jgi:hypothetical protein
MFQLEEGLMNPTIKKTLIASSIAMALGAPGAQASLVTAFPIPAGNVFYTNNANFTMLAGNGGVVGGTNDVWMQWNGLAYTSSSDYAGPGVVANVTATSTAPFFGHRWTAHDIQVFTPGSYTFDPTLGGGALETGTLSATVGAGQLGMHMLFDWNGNLNIDVFVTANMSSMFGAGLLYSTTLTAGGAKKCDSSFTGTIVKNCLWDGAQVNGAGFPIAGAPTKGEIWMLASMDPDGDGINGIPMPAGGPFAGFNANFNANMAVIPVPAAVWLFGSGLLGLVGIARRKNKKSA